MAEGHARGDGEFTDKAGQMTEAAKRLESIITPHRLQHDEIVREVTHEGRKTTTAYRVATQTPLDRYFHRRQISEIQWKAGNELFEDWYAAGLEPQLVADLTKVRVDESRATRLSESRARRRERFNAALRAVGPIASNEVVQVVCQQQPAGSKIKMEILRRGLTVLAVHYGY